MPTQVYNVTATPVDLLTATAIDGTPLSLVMHKTYLARYEAIGAVTIMRAIESASPPNADDIGLPILPYEHLRIDPASGLARLCVGANRGRVF